MKNLKTIFAIITFAIVLFSCEKDSPLVITTPPVVNIPVVIDPNAPTIESLSTLSIDIGDILLINATNLQEENTVKIGSIAISQDYIMSRLIPTQLRVIVPKEAIAGGTVTLSNTKGIFTFNPGITIKNTNLPVINDYYPKTGRIGDIITVEGQNFDYRQNDAIPSVIFNMLNQYITAETFTPTKMTFKITDSFYLGGQIEIEQKYTNYRYTFTPTSFAYQTPIIPAEFFDSQWQGLTPIAQTTSTSPLIITQSDKFDRFTFPYLTANPNCGFTNCGGRILMYFRYLNFIPAVLFLDPDISFSWSGGIPMDQLTTGQVRFFLVKNPGRYGNVNQNDTYEEACNKLGVNL